ncbi:hypothetical protein E2C01_094864 [Portunus trituberculatus]|uniref:Uncharacterized protein n=1 Tax=Portunus trituberculatus TaxID=210409 RepID=A0A5B7JNB4_PORTR|nr:hypothetical protein [Portunus trituberculatus]
MELLASSTRYSHNSIVNVIHLSSSTPLQVPDDISITPYRILPHPTFLAHPPSTTFLLHASPHPFTLHHSTHTAGPSTSHHTSLPCTSLELHALLTK